VLPCPGYHQGASHLIEFISNHLEKEAHMKTHLRSAVVLVLALSMVAAGCGSDDADDAAPVATTAAPAAAVDLSECAVNTVGDVPGVDTESGVVKLGTSQPFTGRAAVAGEGLLAGIQIAVDEVNAAGGVDGCTFELAWEDDRFEIEQMVTNVRKLIDNDGVWGFVGTAGSQAIPSTYPDIEGAGTPLWAPVSPADQDIQEVYLLGATRTAQGMICIDYFAEQGVTKVAAIGQDNEMGVEAFNAIDTQAPVHGMEIVAKEEVEVLSDAVGPAVLAVIESGAEGVLTAVDNAQNGLIMDGFHEAGFNPLICSDQGAAGAGGPNTVSLANPEAADGFLGALQNSLTDTDNDFINHWSALADAYDGPGKDGARNFSLQTYSYMRAFLELWDRLDGNYSYDNFHAVAETLADNPISIASLPPISCGPLPGGHSCAVGAGMARYDADTETWSQVRDFLAPATSKLTPTAAAASSDSEAATARVEAFRQGQGTLPISEPLAESPAGKSAAYVQCSVVVCEEIRIGIAGAADALGMSLEVFSSDDTPEGTASAWQAAVDSGADVVISSGNPREWFADQLAALEAAGTPVIVWSIPEGYEPGNGITANLLTVDDYYFYGVLMADYAVSQNGGEGEVVFFGLPAFPVLSTLEQGFIDEMNNVCPSCPIKNVSIDLMGLIGGEVPGQVVSTLQSTPDASYAVFAFGGMMFGVPEALADAGIDVPAVSQAGGAMNFGFIAEGRTQTAEVGLASEFLGWRGMDAAARALAGQSPGRAVQPAAAVIEGHPDILAAGLPLQILEADDTGFLSTDPNMLWPGVEGFKALYTELWGG
jgi:branched-chain amino acid transport system substrate-binding protein